MGFHDPEVDRIRDAAVDATEREREAAVRDLGTALGVPAELLKHDLNHWSQQGQLEEAAEQTRKRLDVAAALAAADEAAERLRLTTAAYWQHLTDSLARERARAENPVCPCCHRPMTREEPNA